MSGFQVIPAIDLRGGNVVRLTRGDFAEETVYHADPPRLACEMAERGATRLHVVDLDGARGGSPVQQAIVLEMAAASGLEIEIGGGIRDLRTIGSYLEAPRPARWVILGTAALRQRPMVFEACERWPGRIIVGIDARRGQVAFEGWLSTSTATPRELAGAFADAGVAAIIYTDIARDGMGTGPNVEATAELARSASIPIIASGGVATIAHLEALRDTAGDGVAGVVVGRAILSGSLDLEAALSVSTSYYTGP